MEYLISIYKPGMIGQTIMIIVHTLFIIFCLLKFYVLYKEFKTNKKLTKFFISIIFIVTFLVFFVYIETNNI